MISNEVNNILDLAGRLRNFPSLRDLMPSALLRGIDFFSDVDSALLDEISGSVCISEFNDGDIICRHGKYDEKFHVLLSGRVTAVIPTPDNPKYELFSLGPGDFFGEEIVFSSEPRENTVIAREKTTTVSLGAEILKPLIKRSSKIMTIMNRLYIDRKLKSDLRSVPIFTKLNPELFQEVISRAELLSFPEDRIIFSEGDPGDSFYLIREGEVKVFRHHENEEKLIAILTDGQFFGEMSLMTDDRRNATVMTLSQTELVKISRENFISIVERDKDMMKELVVVVHDRIGQQADALRNPEIAVATRRILELNRDVNRHLDILSQCMVDTEHGSALLATMLGSRYPYVYPRDSACASRFLYRLSISNLNAGETAFRHLQEISRFILKCQRDDGYWGQRYGIDLSDKGIYRQEDNVAHGVIILSRYLLAAKKRNRDIPSLDRYLDAISRASGFAKRNYYRNELHLFYSTTSIHESAIERGYTIWVNYAYLLMLRLIERLTREFSIGDRFREELNLKNSFGATIEKAFTLTDRYVRRIRPDGIFDLRPDITLMSPFFFGTGMDENHFDDNEQFRKSMEYIEDMLWDPDLGMLQRYLPFIEDPETHIHAGNGPWVQYTAMLAQYNFYAGNLEKGNRILETVDRYKSKEGYLCEHLTTPERFYEFKELEWMSGRDFGKEFDQEILIGDISYDKIVEELNHMKKSYDAVESQCQKVGPDGYISFAIPLMWSHAEYAMALLLRAEKEIKDNKW